MVRDIQIDISKPRDNRPMIGFDIEQWRGENNLSKYEAQFALGLRNSNHYNTLCREHLLPPAIEIAIRIYDEFPYARGWAKFTLRELFNLMYGDALRPFRGSPLETLAKVDLGSRFCKLFGRSPARQYQWLGDPATRNSSDLSAYSDVEVILSKLKQVDHPAEVLERIAGKVWKLRGTDLDVGWPIPTLSNPPRRQKAGRKPGSERHPAGGTEPLQADRKQKTAARRKAFGATESVPGTISAGRAAKRSAVPRTSGKPR